MTAGSHSETVRRAALPELMLVPDVALALQRSTSYARKAVLLGECGPFVRVGGRLAILRTAFLASLAQRQEAPVTTTTRGRGCA